jgi:methylmalonyl-CoA/ethylmalonyl-CoA epimerase
VKRKKEKGKRKKGWRKDTMKATIDHIGIAVSDIAGALAFFRDVLGLELEAAEEVASQRVRAHFVHPHEDGGPGATFELLEPTADDSPIAKFVAKRGAGMHHVALRVDDIVAALAELKGKGVRLIDEAPRRGAHGALIAFLHPASTHGVLVELKQTPHA